MADSSESSECLSKDPILSALLTNLQNAHHVWGPSSRQYDSIRNLVQAHVRDGKKSELTDDQLAEILSGLKVSDGVS